MIDDKTNNAEKESENRIDLVKVLSVLWKRRKLLTVLTIVVTILGISISFFLPSKFTSTATILPDADKSKVPSGISDLASLAGVSVGGEGSFTKLYPAIIKSEAVLKPVIYHKYYSTKKNDSLDLIAFWELTGDKPELNYQQTFLTLSKALEVVMDTKTQIITLKLEESEPQLTADIINQVINELDRFIRTKRNTSASEQRKFIESRLTEVKIDLSNSEDRLKSFREKNRIIIGSPELMLEQERYIREVNINATLYTELKKQYELVKIEEVKNVPIINIMDKATAAATRTSPRRREFLMNSFVIGLVLGTGYVLYRKFLQEKTVSFLRSINKREM